MREHEFRAWLPVIKEMTYPHTLDELISWDIKTPFDHKETAIWLQYTRLNDCNDKRIYNGDIVKVTDANGEINEYKSDTGIGVVEWLEKWGFWNVSGIENALGDLIYNYEVEVIGNKWESPELLKGENHENIRFV